MRLHASQGFLTTIEEVSEEQSIIEPEANFHEGLTSMPASPAASVAQSDPAIAASAPKILVEDTSYSATLGLHTATWKQFIDLASVECPSADNIPDSSGIESLSALPTSSKFPEPREALELKLIH
ncbi:hypothetical protein EV182_008906, partial [Spiromyces aspiralis]